MGLNLVLRYNAYSNKIEYLLFGYLYLIYIINSFNNIYHKGGISLGKGIAKCTNLTVLSLDLRYNTYLN